MSFGTSGSNRRTRSCQKPDWRGRSTTAPWPSGSMARSSRPSPTAAAGCRRGCEVRPALAELTPASRPRASDFGIWPPLPRASWLGHWESQGSPKALGPGSGVGDVIPKRNCAKCISQCAWSFAQSAGCSARFVPNSARFVPFHVRVLDAPRLSAMQRQIPNRQSTRSEV